MKPKKENELPPSRPLIKVGLARVLGLSDAVFIGIASLIGGGIFTVTGLALGYAGPSFILVIILNGLIALMTTFAYAELGSTFPEAGGGFIWVKRGLGNLAGHISGWISWFAHTVACGLYSISFGFYSGTILFLMILPVFGINIPFFEGHLFQKFIAILMMLWIGYINFRSVAGTSQFGKIFVCFEIFILLVFGIFGLISFFKKPDLASNFLPLFPLGICGLFTAMGLMYIGFEGSEIIVQSGEELKNPKKNLPRALMISLAVIIFLYCLTIFSALSGVRVEGEMSWRVLSEAGQGALIKASSFFMPGFEWLIIFGGLFAAAAALNSTVFSSSHVSFAMARAGCLPKLLSKIHPKNQTPYIAVITSTLLILLIISFLPLKDVAAVFDLLFIFLFAQLHIALIALRKKLPDIERPFKVPLYPLPSLIAIFAYFLLIFQLFHVSPIGVVIVLFWLLSGFLLYYVYTKPVAEEKIEKQIVFEEKIRLTPKKKYQILLPLSDEAGWENILKLALILAREKQGELCALRVKNIPRPLPLIISEKDLEKEKEFLEKILKHCGESQVNVDARLMIARSVSRTILETAQKEDSDLLILSWKGYVKTRGKIFGKSLDRVLRETKCDLVVARINNFNDLKDIFLPSRVGPHTKFAGEIARIIAKDLDSKIHVFYVASEKEFEGKKAQDLENVIIQLGLENFPHIKSEILTQESLSGRQIAYQIVERGQDFGCILMASAREKLFRERIFGNIPEIVARNSTKSLILVKHHQEIIQPLLSYLKSRL